MDEDDAETTTRYICPVCGFSRRDVETVVKHIDSRHPDEGHVSILRERGAPKRRSIRKMIREWFRRRLP